MPHHHSHEDTPLVNKESPTVSKWTKFWIGAEFGKNFVKTLLSTAISNATLLTYVLDLPTWKFGVGLLAVEVSCPMALMFALCEAYSHLQQSQSFAADEVKDIESGEQEEIQLSDVPLTKKQIAAAIIHYCSDILEDSVTPFTLTQLLASEASLPALQKALDSHTLKCMIATGSLFISAIGNKREFDNTLTAARENNLREIQQERKRMTI